MKRLNSAEQLVAHTIFRKELIVQDDTLIPAVSSELPTLSLPLCTVLM